MTSPAGGESAAGSQGPRTGYPYLDAVLDPPGSVLAMAHRGGAAHPEIPGAENTLHAFRHAVSLGYRYLETDVHATRDGVLLAFHDKLLDRVTDLTGRLSEVTAEHVATARIGGAHAVPTLAELLEEFPDCRFNIDLKAPTAVQPLAELVRRTGCAERVCVGSFSDGRIREFRDATEGKVATAAGPREVALVLSRIPTRLLRRTLRHGPRVLQVPWHHRRWPITVVSPRFVRRAHTAGLHVHVWTGEARSRWASIDDQESLETLLDLGVDGVIADRTDVLKEVLVRRGQWRDGP